MYKIAISTGEISGEEHLARVLQYFPKDYQFFGMCSNIPRVQKIIDSKKWCNLNGFNIFLILYKSIYALTIFVYNLIKKKPDALILVDYPDFNLRLAFFAKLLNIKVIYFIPPKLWAWRETRIKKIKKYVNQMIVIFPFEVNFYQERGFKNVHYLGHPFSDFITPEDKSKIRNELNLENKKTIAIFPGSRKSEVKYLINTLNTSLDSYKEFQIVLSVAKNFQIDDFKVHENIKFIKNDSIKVMQASDYGILKCGTCNLEAAFIELPHLVIYKMSSIAYEILIRLVKISSYSLVNIILPNTTKELIQNQCNKENINKELQKLIQDTDYYQNQILSFKKIKEVLGYKKNVSEDIAKKIQEIL